jgi:septum site-determining protein MinC
MTVATPRRPRADAGSPLARAAAFDLKGTMASLTVLRLRSTDLYLIERQLRIKISQQPQLFVDAPVLLDFGALAEGEDQDLRVPVLLAMLRACKLVPVAATNASDTLQARLIEAGLGILKAPPPRADRAPDPLPPSSSPSPSSSSSSPTPFHGPVVVTHPVRSGQVVHAHNNDLVVLASVNPGGQVIADGHLHIYATLRGRAVAGAAGLPGARIFCQKLEAELLAIAGVYVMADEIPAARRGKPAQIYLEGSECRIAPL